MPSLDRLITLRIYNEPERDPDTGLTLQTTVSSEGVYWAHYRDGGTTDVLELQGIVTTFLRTYVLREFPPLLQEHPSLVEIGDDAGRLWFVEAIRELEYPRWKWLEIDTKRGVS